MRIKSVVKAILLLTLFLITTVYSNSYGASNDIIFTSQDLIQPPSHGSLTKTFDPVTLQTDTNKLLITYLAHSQSLTNFNKNNVTVVIKDSNNAVIVSNSDSYDSESTTGTPIPAYWHSVMFSSLNLKANSTIKIEVTVTAGDYMNYVDKFVAYNNSSDICSDFATTSYNNNPSYKIVNNTYNTQVATPPVVECINTTGWNWNIVNSSNNVVSYQSVIFGWHPWDPAGTTPLLPIRIVNIQSVNLNFDVSTIKSNDSVMNTAVDIWVNSDATPNPSNIIGEIMIWTQNYGMTPWPGAQIIEPNLTVGGSNYAVYYLANGPSGKSVAFVRTSPTSSGTLPCHELFKFLTDKGIFTGDNYISSIEFGNEVVRGNGTTTLNSYSVSVTPRTPTDFNGDGKADILWRNTSTGEVWSYLMNGMAIASQGSVSIVSDSNWKIQGIGDFNGDGKADILWRNTATGQIWMYLMDGTAIASQVSVATVGDVNWKIQGIGDFDGDGKADILWRNTATGQVWLYLMNGTTIASQGSVATVSNMNRKLQLTGAFDGDSNAAILWRNISTGEVWTYLMNGTAISSQGSVATVSNNWTIQGIGDFNGDGRADILWRNASTGQVWMYLMNGTSVSSQGPGATVADANWKIAGIGDFNGDGTADILWRNISTGEVWTYLMNGTAISSQGSVATVSNNWTIQLLSGS
ncbi:MAG: VCBS repeat-containing protein [Deltaproteobacteria bacterium]|nr:VCBS repeat-containing protein [Deltaproteobacteria bacterium]